MLILNDSSGQCFNQTKLELTNCSLGTSGERLLSDLHTRLELEDHTHTHKQIHSMESVHWTRQIMFHKLSITHTHTIMMPETESQYDFEHI